MAKKEDILVIGGGVIGVCSAYYLMQKGMQVTILDKGEICSGCSYGNAGLLVPSHSVPLPAPGVLSKGLKWMFDSQSPFYIKPRLDLELFSWLWKFRGFCNQKAMRKTMPIIGEMSLASLELYAELAAIDGLEFGFTQDGVLMVYSTENGYKEGIEEAHLLQDIGLKAELLDGETVLKMQPCLLPGVVGGVFFEQDAHLIPAEFVRGLARVVEEAGGILKTSTEVLGFETSGSRISTVKTTRGDFHPDQVVLAGGSWSPVLARDLDLKLSIQAAKGYSITVVRPETCPTIPLLMGEARVGITPMGQTLRFAGTLELAGLDLSINRGRVEAIMRAAPKYISGTEDLEIIEIWRGLRPCTPDGLPIIGRTESFQNLTIAAGHAMIGVTLGPITGKMVSQIVSDETPEIDLIPLKAERFN